MTDWEKISAPDWEQLSAYLDGELLPQEVASLEARLEHDDTLQQALRELRGTVEIIHTLPAVDPPRDFVLTEQMAGRAGGGLLAGVGRGLLNLRLYPTLQLGTALAALALVSLVGFDVLVNNSLAGLKLGSQVAPQAGLEADQLMAAELPATEAPEFMAEQQPAAQPTGQARAGEQAEDEAESEQLDAAAEPSEEQEAEAGGPAQPEAEAGAAAQPEAEAGPATESAAAELRAAEPLEAPAFAEQPADADQAETGLEPGGRAALTAAEIGLAAATVLLLIFTLRERRRA